MEQGNVEAGAEPQDKMSGLQNQVQEVIDEMKGNMEKILDREVKADDLLNKSMEMEEGAQELKKTSQKVSRTYWCRNVELIVVISLAVLVMVIIIILVLAGVIPANATAPPAVSPTKEP